MYDMYHLMVKIGGYFGCIAIGAIVSWYLTKLYYEEIVDEEIKSIHEVQRKKVDREVNHYTDILETEEYISHNNDFPKDDMFEKPHLITMETFDDADPSYEKILLEYYTEDCCLVENDEIIDPGECIGFDNLEWFAKRMDIIIMYIRNEKLGVDYEVTKIVAARWNE